MKKPESEKKRHLVKCYLDDKEYLVLRALSIHMGVSNSEVLRMSLSPQFKEDIEKRVEKETRKNSPGAENKELIKNALYQLSKVGNNLNQLTRLANQGTVLEKEITGCLSGVSSAVHELKEQIRHGNSKTRSREE